MRYTLYWGIFRFLALNIWGSSRLFVNTKEINVWATAFKDNVQTGRHYFLFKQYNHKSLFSHPPPNVRLEGGFEVFVQDNADTVLPPITVSEAFRCMAAAAG